MTDIHNIQEKYYTISVRTGCRYKGLINYLKFQWRHHRYLHEHIQDAWEEIATRAHDHSGYVIDYHQPNVMKFKPMPMDWFGEGIEREFEGRKVVIPKDYESYLTHIYGDYMTPPPVDQRGGHEFIYVNLDERISGNLKKQIIADIKSKTRFVWSFRDELNYWNAKLNK